MAPSGRPRDSHGVTSERPDLQRIVVVDDSDGFRSLLQWFLGSLPEVEIVAEARDGVDAIEQVGRTKPDLVLMDVCMPKLDGLQTTRKLRTGGRVGAHRPSHRLRRHHPALAGRGGRGRRRARQVESRRAAPRGGRGRRHAGPPGPRANQGEPAGRRVGREMNQGERHEALSRVLTSLAGVPPSADDISDDRVAAIVATGLLTLPTTAIDEVIRQSLAAVGLQRGVDRAYYYRLDEAAERSS